MNCVNHPEAAVSAFCQNCGRGLCSACVRDVQGNVFCEPCLASRIPGAPGAYPPGSYPPGVAPPAGANPGTAAVLGFIPGVGAMYNGQYIKAIVHVIVFVVLIGLADRYWFFGLLIGFWVLYQVFDAHQTAKARRDGLPLPDPFGLNELGNAIAGHTTHPPVNPVTPPGTPPPPPPYEEWAGQARRQAQQWGEQAGQWGEQLRQRIVTEAGQPFQPAQPFQAGQPFQPGFGPMPGPGSPGFVAGATGYPPPPPPPGQVPPGYVPPVYGPPTPVPPQMELERARREPIGAIVLILLGMLFLFNTLGFFSFGWIGHGWPWIIVIIAVWLLARGGGSRFRMRMPPPGPPPSPEPPAPPAGGVR